MRRPAPLPTDAEGARPVEEQPPVDVVLPLPAGMRTRDARQSAEGGLETDEGLASSAAPVGGADVEEPDVVSVRQVWAAARARRKALRAEVRRFTTRQRRRRIVWITSATAILALVLGALAAAYSPLFAVEKISVIGTTTLDAAAVEAALSEQLGVPLARVDSSAVKADLVQFPLVESYTLEARPPHELVVRIVERTPIGSLESDAGFTLVDAAGVALSTTAEPAPGHPVITVTGGVGSPAFRAVGTVFRSLPEDIRAQVAAMNATTGNDVTLTLAENGAQVVWGNADDSAEKALVLASVMTARPPGDVVRYDVSSPGAVVVR